MSVVVVGAGWAGLACAIKLVQAGHKVTLIEATPNTGGRARSIDFANHTVDNGQHLLIGAYTETIKLLKAIDIAIPSVLQSAPMSLQLHGNNKNIALTIPNLWAPLHIMVGLVLSRGITKKEKFIIAKLFFNLYKINFTLKQDCSILSVLKSLGQSEDLISHLWEPIALAVMSTPIELASANVFFQILKNTFTGHHNNASWLFASKDLTQLLPDPAIKYLIAKGAKIILQQSITELLFVNEQCLGVANANHCWHANNIVLATPAWVTAKLLTGTPAATMATNLAQLRYNAITTIYFYFAAPVNLPYQMLGLLAGPMQWVFDRKVTAQPNILSAIMTDNTGQLEYAKAELIQAAIKQLRQHFPTLPALLETKVIREKRAAFLCTTEMQQLRPTNITSVKNLFLAGDYTQTNYPATIEGAVKSGVWCASSILHGSLST